MECVLWSAGKTTFISSLFNRGCFVNWWSIMLLLPVLAFSLYLQLLNPVVDQVQNLGSVKTSSFLEHSSTVFTLTDPQKVTISIVLYFPTYWLLALLLFIFVYGIAKSCVSPTVLMPPRPLIIHRFVSSLPSVCCVKKHKVRKEKVVKTGMKWHLSVFSKYFTDLWSATHRNVVRVGYDPVTSHTGLLLKS